MITEMKEMMIERLKVWSAKNQNRFPEKIMVYRDGVSEGMHRTLFHSMQHQEDS
jgi:eukaryotic translation initiation factor 2C